MAVARGFSAVDEGVVRERLVAILEGDRDELATATARLVAMRDAASERLAFEFARDVQIRVEALRWISEAPCASARRPA